MKKYIGVVSILFIAVLGLSACGSNNESSEKKEQSAITKKEKNSILPIGNEYVYQDKSDYVKLTILSDNEWSIQTDEMHVPEKFTVKDMKQDKEGYKLLEMTANKEINGHVILSILEDNPMYYYLVNENDKIGFDIKVNENNKDIKNRADLRGFLIKQ
ncbi:hypothetical protein P0E66_11420 [Enterococcus faecalis]|uniref:hypothetical protein n=1 Tax=Enterococcus faecalis TaxID=1351 RepID=UPI0025B22233|nr:hypothetical protein [Enterococcus faecalis]MDN3201736.1 hypothetical protein [Enterococcus faecalis]